MWYTMKKYTKLRLTTSLLWLLSKILNYRQCKAVLLKLNGVKVFIKSHLSRFLYTCDFMRNFPPKNNSKVCFWKFEVVCKVIYPKYSKHWPYTMAYTIDCVCSKILNHGLFHSLFKLIPCPIHWIVCVSLFKFHIWILKQF